MNDDLSPRPAVVFQAPNHIGLGHLNRLSCIALALREMDDHVRCLFVVEGNSHGILEEAGLPYLSLPHPDTVKRSRDWSEWSSLEKERVVGAIAESIVRTVRPVMVVYDCFPSESFIDPVIREGIKVALCVRKVKSIEDYIRDPRVARVLEVEPQLIIPHEPGDFLLPDFLLPRAEYVGPIVKHMPVDPEPVQVRFKLIGKQILVISGGGGGYRDTAAYFNLCLDAFDKLKSRMDNVVALLITGPLFSQWGDLRLTSDVRIIPFDPAFTSTCATADLVLSQGGYNSINELVLLGTPTICIPAERGFDDQFERARDVAAKCANVCCFEGASAEHLAALMEARLKTSPNRDRGEEPDGAYRAALHILKAIGCA
jgi:predicted glycosyltransferase